MPYNSVVLLFIFFYLSPYFTSAEVVLFQQCSGDSKNCTVSNVRVSPCPEAEKGSPCVVRKGKSALIQFDYDGPKDISGLETRAYWATWPVDLPLIGMDTDGCAHTQCPTTGKQEEFKFDLTIGKKFPTRGYDVKWRLYKEDVMDCCFIFKIKLVSGKSN